MQYPLNKHYKLLNIQSNFHELTTLTPLDWSKSLFQIAANYGKPELATDCQRGKHYLISTSAWVMGNETL